MCTVLIMASVSLGGFLHSFYLSCLEAHMGVVLWRSFPGQDTWRDESFFLGHAPFQVPGGSLTAGRP